MTMSSNFKRDIRSALAAGFFTGLFLIPVTKNIEVFEKIPSPYLVLLLGLPILSAAGIAVARFLGSYVPIIWQVAKFGLVGVLNTAIDFGVLNILIFATGVSRGWPLAVLNIFAFVAAMTNSYWWNKKWVFEDRTGGEAAQFAEFIVISGIAALISSGIVGGVTGYIEPLGNLSREQWANVAKVGAVVFSFIWNFLGYKFIVFRKSH